MARQSLIRMAVLLGGVAALAGCEDGQPMAFLKAPATTQDGASSSATPSKTIERDVEAPEIFFNKGPGLWDGRPSLGGVWVAHPDVKEPERVIIRNSATDKFVVGALFRRERATPGPKIQVSSDAAEALGMLAGAPTELSVVALKREESAPVAGTVVAGEGAKDASAAPSDAIKAEAIEATTLAPAAAAKAAPKPVGDIAATAGAALAKADAAPGAAPKAAAKPAAPKSAASPAPSGSVSKPYVQLGIFSQEANAKRAETSLTKAGIGAKVIREEWQGKTFWRVIGGPAASNAARDALITKIKGMGFPDSYAVAK
jgi:cell division septation protein DedD